MTTFDSFFFTVFQYYKATYKKKANSIALFYISTLQCSLLLLSGILLSAFLNEMNSITISPSTAWTLFVILSVFIYFKNWIQYSGKKRKVLNAKRNNKKASQQYNIWLLWFFLAGSIGLSIILLSTAF